MDKVYSIRNLKYNIYQLLLVGGMMLLATQTLGLVCYNLLPNVKPILLDNAGADAKQISLILATLPNAISFVLCPLISTISDKTRTRIGRRMPYLIFSAPVLALLLVMIAFYHEITAFVIGVVPAFGNINGELWVLAILMLVFQIVFLFPGSVVYYLVADVIPKDFIGRYTAVATVCSSAITAGFNFFLLKASVENTKLMFILLGVIYLAVYILLLCTVKEGEYPPLSDDIDKSKSSVARGYEYFLLFFKECFGHKIYILLFLSTGLNQASNICRGMYNVLFATKDIGVSVELFGKIMGIGSIIAMVAVFFMGKLMDKFHPMFLYIYGGILIIITNIFGYYFVYTPLTFGIIGVVTALMYAVQGVAGTPLLVNMLPMDKFGQFASANSMVNSVVVILGSYLGGYLTHLFGYRVMFIWDFAVTTIAMSAMFLVYLEWKKFGGKNYIPPQRAVNK